MGLEWQQRALTRVENRAKIRIGKGNDAIGIKEEPPKDVRDLLGVLLVQSTSELRLIKHC